MYASSLWCLTEIKLYVLTPLRGFSSSFQGKAKIRKGYKVLLLLSPLLQQLSLACHITREAINKLWRVVFAASLVASVRSCQNLDLLTHPARLWGWLGMMKGGRRSGGLLWENWFFQLRCAGAPAWKNRTRLFTALHLGRYFTQSYLEKAKIPSENATWMNTPNYAAF